MTAEEYFKEVSPNDNYGLRAKLISIGMEKFIYDIMVNFARLKVKEALEAAYENVKLKELEDGDEFICSMNDDYGDTWVLDKDSILNAYDINSIE